MAGNIKECVLGVEGTGIIENMFGKEIVKMYDDFYNASDALLLDPAKRVAYASDTTVALMEGELQQAKRIKLQTVVANLQLDEYISKQADPMKALESIMTPNFKYAPKNLEMQQRAVLNQVMSPMSDFVLRFEKGIFTGTRLGTDKTRGLVPRQKELMNLITDVVEELYSPGITKNAEAAAFAKAYSESSEHARLLFNQSGGAIRKNAKWALPQVHHAGRILAATYEPWAKALKGFLDLDNMVDNITGIKLDDAGLNRVLKKVYDSITTEGRNQYDNLLDGVYSTGNSVAKRHQEHRVLIFKDGKSHLAYQKMFGEEDIFTLMVDHLHSMSKDIAEMQVLGPNSESTIKFLKARVVQIADQRVAAGEKASVVSKAKASAAYFEDMFRVYKGLGEPERPTYSKFMQNFRAILMAAKLGATPLIAAPTDLATSRRMAKFMGMEPSKAISNYIKALTNLSPGEQKKFATEMGIFNQSMLDTTGGLLARYMDQDTASPIFRFIADSSLRLNGLTKLTESGRMAAAFTMTSSYANNVAKSFDQLNPQMQRGLLRYEIDAVKWDKIRQAKLHSRSFGDQSSQFLRASDIAKIQGLAPGEARDLADTYLRLILSETETAIPSATIAERALLRGQTRSGSIPGEIVSSFAMFKNWPMSFYNKHIRRTLYEADTPMKKAAAFADLSLSMMLMGALGVQLMEIAKGRKPMEMDATTEAGRNFWWSAVTRSGGLGPIFDVAVGLGDYRQGLSGYISGPVIGSIDSISYALFGSAKDIYEGEPANAGTRIFKEVLRNTPYQSNWMINTVMRRVMFERIMLWSDPAYIKQLEKGIKRDAAEGKEYYWTPGQTTPSGSPFE